MDQGVAAILGALVGGVGTWSATWAVEVRRDERSGKNLAMAAAAEIDAVLTVLRARAWRDSIAGAAAMASDGVVTLITIHVKDDYLPMCRAAMAQAGVVDGRLAVLLARLISLADALIADLQRLANHVPGSSGSMFDWSDAPAAERIYKDLLQIIDAGLFVGDEAVLLVGRLYPGEKASFWRRLRRAATLLLRG